MLIQTLCYFKIGLFFFFLLSFVSIYSEYNVGDPGSVPGLGRSPGAANGNPFQYSCLENPWMKEPGRLQFMGSKESDVTE